MRSERSIGMIAPLFQPRAISMEPMLNTALKAAREAGKFIARAMQDIDRIEVQRKGVNDFVTEVDRHAEQIIISMLQKAYPDHAFVGEESGESGKTADAEYVWIIDPLDGTTNFVRSFPHFCVSIGCTYRGDLQHGVVLDPVRNEEFTASRGRGAQLNGRRIRVSGKSHLDGALLGTGFPFKKAQMPWVDDYFAVLQQLSLECAGIRRAGSAALDLAYVAAGRFDAYWEYGLKPWDIAAGALLVQEAGGMVSNFSGEYDFMKTGNIVCGTPRLHETLLKRLPTLGTS